ncbi:MAG: YdcH family protein [Advenella sp.]
MFPEYRDLISRLKEEDANFKRLFKKHNDLDQELQNLETQDFSEKHTEIEKKKKEKLQLKDQLYNMLKERAAT